MKDTVQLYIGRGHDAHVRVTDISVSRLHATLIISIQGYYFLTDNDSKFGTLSLVKTPLELPQGSQTTIQIGRSIFDIEVKNLNNFTFNNCLCFGSKQKKQIGAEENLVTLDGNIHFPANFASQQFLDLMDKRKLMGMRRNSRKSSTKLNPVGQQHRQKKLVPLASPDPLPTENRDESVVDERNASPTLHLNQFVVGMNSSALHQAPPRHRNLYDPEDDEDDDDDSDESDSDQEYEE